MIYNNLVYCGVGCIALGIIALYLLLLCWIYAMLHVCIEEKSYVCVVLCCAMLMLLIGVGLLVVGIGAF